MPIWITLLARHRGRRLTRSANRQRRQVLVVILPKKCLRLGLIDVWRSEHSVLRISKSSFAIHTASWWLLKEFDLGDDFQTDKSYHRLLRIAQHHEIAKIALSTKLVDRIFADENQIGSKDRQGKELYLDIEVTREALEGLIGGEITRSIELCRDLLKENGYRSEDVDRVVMIGGPSRMPIVRNRVSEELGIRVDLETDPMTAVAMGAAIFAEGRDWSGTVIGAKGARSSGKSKGSLDIRYEFPARTADNHIRIRVRVGSEVAKQGYRLVADTEDGWTSGQVALEMNTEIRDVPLSRRGDNKIRMTVLDPRGAPKLDAVSEISVFSTLATTDGMPTTHTISAKVVTGAGGVERNTLYPLVKKGTPLRSSGMETFRAARDLRANDGTYLDFELFEQTEGVDDPGLNLPIGAFRIDSEELERGDVVRKGDNVFVSRERLASTNGATVQITRLAWFPPCRLTDFSYV